MSVIDDDGLCLFGTVTDPYLPSGLVLNALVEAGISATNPAFWKELRVRIFAPTSAPGS